MKKKERKDLSISPVLALESLFILHGGFQTMVWCEKKGDSQECSYFKYQTLPHCGTHPTASQRYDLQRKLCNLWVAFWTNPPVP